MVPEQWCRHRPGVGSTGPQAPPQTCRISSWGRGSVERVATSPPGGSDARQGLRTAALTCPLIAAAGAFPFRLSLWPIGVPRFFPSAFKAPGYVFPL